MRRLLCLFLLAGLAARASAQTEWHGPQPQLPTVELAIGDARVTAEVAREPEQHERGLMFRRGLKDNVGMLFVFDHERKMAFWMQNTLIPLSIAYIDRAGKIVEVYDMQPLDTRVVPSQSDKILYALEMNQGWFILNKISPGAEVRPVGARYGEGLLAAPKP
jgi:uncharacterized membrane protein (UPF0127 family)